MLLSLTALGPDWGSPWGQPGPSGCGYFTLDAPPGMASCAQELVLAWTVWELDGWALSSSAWGKFLLILATALLKSWCEAISKEWAGTGTAIQGM